MKFFLLPQFFKIHIRPLLLTYPPLSKEEELLSPRHKLLIWSHLILLEKKRD